MFSLYMIHKSLEFLFMYKSIFNLLVRIVNSTVGIIIIENLISVTLGEDY